MSCLRAEERCKQSEGYGKGRNWAQIPSSIDPTDILLTFIRSLAGSASIQKWIPPPSLTHGAPKCSLQLYLLGEWFSSRGNDLLLWGFSEHYRMFSSISTLLLSRSLERYTSLSSQIKMWQ
jgi:hypothetical protein